MKVEIEYAFWVAISVIPKVGGVSACTPRDIIKEMVALGVIASAKQAWATLTKWSCLGLYDYGVSLDLGWLNPGAVFPRMAELRRTQASPSSSG